MTKLSNSGSCDATHSNRQSLLKQLNALRKSIFATSWPCLRFSKKYYYYSSHFLRANSYVISLARRCVPDYRKGKEKEKRCDLRRERKRGRDRDGSRR